MAGGEFSGDDEEGKGQCDSAENQNAQSTAGFGDPKTLCQIFTCCV